MNPSEIQRPIDFSSLKLLLDAERKAIIRVNAFSEDENLVRSSHDASVILDSLATIQLALDKTFTAFPALIPFFNQEFGFYGEFLNRGVVLEICFLDDFLFPDKEIGLFTDLETGALAIDKLKEQELFFLQWSSDIVQAHEKTQNLLKEKFDSEIKPKDFPCQCNLCLGEFRNRFRDIIFDESMELIKQTHKDLEDSLNSSSRKTEEIFKEFQKTLDKKFFSIRFKLKRSVLSRIESQIKERVKGNFTFPAPLAKQRADLLKPWFQGLLKSQALRADLISDHEFERFLTLLGTNLWRGEYYLDVEFSKLIKSVLAFKRKDISATILKRYLGEFWIHSRARELTRRIIYHMGPTNSGKTYHAVQELCQVKKGCYLAPLRLLAGELYDTLTERGVKTTLLTGEEVIEVDGATHYSSTIEMARFHEDFDCCVIDEVQMISDPQRGWAWTRALVNMCAPEIHICGDPSVLKLIEQIVALCGDTLEIRKYERMCELKVAPAPLRLGDLERSDALIVFSRKNALKYKAEIENLGFRVSIVYGRLGPEVRREQARKFDAEETDVIVSTDAIAMGMNLPIRRIIFSTLTKHIDDETIPITLSEIKQIAGRAGRFNRFPIGEVNCLTKVENGLNLIREALQTELPQKTQCMVGPDLDIFTQVNTALRNNALPELTLSEFLRLFNTMTFQKPFFCVDLKEMIELAEMVEEADSNKILSIAEIFGLACAPVNLGLLEHVQYYVWILNHFAKELNVDFAPIEPESNDIDYLETSIKCVELYQWLARHFNFKRFEHNEIFLLENKSKAIEKLNKLLSDKIVLTCASCGVALPDNSQFGICESCFADRRSARFQRGRRGGPARHQGAPTRQGGGGSGQARPQNARRTNFNRGPRPAGPKKFATAKSRSRR
ncbi:MAG: hypothetical protein A2X86_17420 [Bdellovibrionales bacterium GWA2_49_15]|nr:MAG: hypothetical protein A2X86_17420 [Bdellovibrionales bacterium GWA2_49_15]HAZ13980.1 hypothetical protein [Bdellovibrionales bacterium]